MARPKALKFVGSLLPDGRPVAHLGNYGIPPQSLDEDQTKALSAEQVNLALDSGLYEAVEPAKTAATPAKAKSEKDSDGGADKPDSGELTPKDSN